MTQGLSVAGPAHVRREGDALVSLADLGVSDRQIRAVTGDDPTPPATRRSYTEDRICIGCAHRLGVRLGAVEIVPCVESRRVDPRCALPVAAPSAYAGLTRTDAFGTLPEVRFRSDRTFDDFGQEFLACRVMRTLPRSKADRPRTPRMRTVYQHRHLGHRLRIRCLRDPRPAAPRAQRRSDQQRREHSVAAIRARSPRRPLPALARCLPVWRATQGSLPRWRRLFRSALVPVPRRARSGAVTGTSRAPGWRALRTHRTGSSL